MWQTAAWRWQYIIKTCIGSGIGCGWDHLPPALWWRQGLVRLHSIGEVCHCKSHHNLLGSKACNPSPGNLHRSALLGHPQLQPRSIQSEKMDLGSIAFLCSFCEFKALPSIAPASVGLTASPPMEAVALLLWALHSHHCLVRLQPSFGHCLHWTYYTEPHTVKNRGPVWDLRQRFMQCRTGPAHGRSLCLL